MPLLFYSIIVMVFLSCFSSEALAFAKGMDSAGKKIYMAKCMSCHHQDRIGFSAPPLLPELLEKINDEKLTKIIRLGLPNTLMPAHPQIGDADLSELIKYLRTPMSVSWTEFNINRSFVKSTEPAKKITYKNILNLTAVVERGLSKVWLMEGENILDTFTFFDIHGGIKYTRNYKQFFIPTRDGRVGKYDLDKGYVGSVRACISLRNITVSSDFKHLVASCLYPQQLVVLDSDTLKLKKIVKLKGKISGIYSLINENKAIYTYRDLPLIGYFDFKSLKTTYKNLKVPIEDFFIDPLDKFIISSSRGGENVSVIDLENQKTVFDFPISGMPHLSSASYWYDKGQFYFATFHIKSNFISIWKMYDWKFEKKVEVGGNGFFVRSHPKAAHLWIDNGSDEVVLFDKKSHEVTKFKPVPGKKFTHTEFSADGSMAYLSIYDKDGAIALYDTATLKEIKKIPASFPVGKYNVVNKEREFLPINLGASVFMGKCWGCHHQEQMAFGPSFKWIANNRNKGMIRTHLDNPKINAINLGYKNPTMPNIPLSEEEKDMLVAYITSYAGIQNLLKEKLNVMKMYNMEEHSLEHPDRVVTECVGYLEWKKLGFKPFSEIDKIEEKKYINQCE
jgi:mono/diheme cytochrome c family protein